MSLTAEDLALRKHGIGSSEIAAIAGLNPWRGPMDVWLAKTGRDHSESNLAQDLGHYLEPVIAQMYVDKLQDERVNLCKGNTIVCEREPWMVATPDYLVFSESENTRLLEIKNVGWRVAPHWESDRAPDYVFAQVQHQMHVVGLERSDVCALLGGRDFFVIPVAYDRAFADALSEIARVFMVEHVQPDKPPPVDASESWKRYVAERFPRQRKDTLDPATPEVEKLVGELRGVKAEESALETRRDELETKLKALIGDRAGYAGDGWYVSWKAPAQGTVSWKSVAEALNPSEELIAKHRSAPSRRLLLQEKS